MRYWQRWLLVIVFSLVSCEEISSSNPSESNITPVTLATEANLPAGEEAAVVRVIDGDTIEVEIQGERYRVRYIGIDTPERGDPFYTEATDLNKQLVEGETVWLVKDVSETDPNGRLLRYIYLLDGTFVNGVMLQEGLARRVTFPPDVAEQTYFAELQEEAQTAGRGLWAENALLNQPCTCSKNSYNCSDFDTQTEAQACFEYCLDTVQQDIHQLDGGGDGLVCESLP